MNDCDIVVCDDLPKNISKIFPQQTFQTCIGGEFLTQIQHKNKKNDFFFYFVIL